MMGETNRETGNRGEYVQMINHHDITRDACMLQGPLTRQGYDWWWHSFTAQDAETGEDKPFFIEFFVCNPALGDMLFVNYEAPDGEKRHNRLWNGGNGWGTVKLYDRRAGKLELVDEIEATHIGCEYGEYGQYDENGNYVPD